MDERNYPIFHHIASGVAANWKAFARILDVKEYEILQIEQTLPDPYKCAYKCLTYKGESETNWNFWKNKLITLQGQGPRLVHELELEYPKLMHESIRLERDQATFIQKNIDTIYHRKHNSKDVLQSDKSEIVGEIKLPKLAKFCADNFQDSCDSAYFSGSSSEQVLNFNEFKTFALEEHKKLQNKLNKREEENDNLRISLKHYTNSLNDAFEQIHFMSQNFKNPTAVNDVFRNATLKRFTESILIEIQDLKDVINSQFKDTISLESKDLKDVTKNQVADKEPFELCLKIQKLEKENKEYKDLLEVRFKELQGLTKEIRGKKINSQASQLAALKQENMKLKTYTLFKSNIMEDIKSQFSKIAEACYNDFKQITKDADPNDHVTDINIQQNYSSLPAMFYQTPSTDAPSDKKSVILSEVIPKKDSIELKKIKELEKELSDLKDSIKEKEEDFNKSKEEQSQLVHQLVQQNDIKFEEIKKLNVEIGKYESLRNIIEKDIDQLPTVLAKKLSIQNDILPSIKYSESVSEPLLHSIPAHVEEKMQKQWSFPPSEPYKEVKWKTPYHQEIVVRDSEHRVMPAEHHIKETISMPQIAEAQHVTPCKRSETCLELQRCDNECPSLLYDAVKDNDMDMFKVLLSPENQPDLKSNYNGESILHLVVRLERIEMCRLLLETTINVNLQDANKKSILHYIAEQNNTDILKLLLNSSTASSPTKPGSPARPGSSEGSYSPLIGRNSPSGRNFSSPGRSGCLPKLGLKINPNLQDVDQRTALHIAILNNNYDIVETLIKVTDVTIQDNKGMKALDLAFKMNNSKITQLFYPK